MLQQGKSVKSGFVRVCRVFYTIKRVFEGFFVIDKNRLRNLCC